MKLNYIYLNFGSIYIKEKFNNLRFKLFGHFAFFFFVKYCQSRVNALNSILHSVKKIQNEHTFIYIFGKLSACKTKYLL